MSYGVRLLFRDKNYHNIETSDIEEARAYLKQISKALTEKAGVFEMYNKKEELVYVCNTDNIIHGMIVMLEDSTK
jgi:hypothetical protein